MNKIRSYITLLVFIILTSGRVFSQEMLQLGLIELLMLTEKENYSVRLEENKLQISQANKQQVIYSMLPSVNIYGGANLVTGLNFDQVSGTLQTEKGRFANSYLNLTLDFTNLLLLKPKIDQAKQQYDIQSYRSTYTKEMTALYIVGKYIEIQQAYKQRSILEEFQKTQKIALDRTSEMVELGSLSPQDKRIQEADLKKIESQLLENENVINSKLNELRWMLGIEDDRQIVLLEDGIQEIQQIYATHDEAALGNLKECYALALEGRNDLKANEINILSQKNDLILKRLSYSPKIYFYYNYGSGFSSFQVNDFETQFFRDNIKSSIGLQFEIPVFNGLSKKATLITARKNYENSQLLFEQSRNQVLSDVSNARAKIKLDIQNSEAYKDLSDVRKQIYDVEMEKYQLGNADILSVSIAYRDYLSASLEYSKQEYQLLYDKYLLSFHLGYSRELLDQKELIR